MIHLYTGDGKGKTTAATGLCIRAAGRDFQVYFARFMKGNDSGELHILKNLSGVTVLGSDKNFGFYHAMSAADKAELTIIHNRMLEELLTAAESGSCSMIVMDEVTYPVKWGLLDREKLAHLLQLGKENPKLELVLTGRDAGQMLEDAADYITEMECVRHPYGQGIKARKGIEF